MFRCPSGLQYLNMFNINKQDILLFGKHVFNENRTKSFRLLIPSVVKVYRVKCSVLSHRAKNNIRVL